MKRYLIGFLILVVVSIALLYAPIFKIKTIGISPLTFINQQACESALSPLIHSNGLRTILLKRVHRKLNNYSQINDISVRFSWPSRLDVTITEKEPWISCIVDNKSLFLDREGILLESAQDNALIQTDNLFIVKGLNQALFNQDRVSPVLLNRIKNIESYLKKNLPDTPLLLERLKDGSWSVVIYDTVSILIGELTDLESKFKRLHYFLGTPEGQAYSKIRYIDLRINHKLLVQYEH